MIENKITRVLIIDPYPIMRFSYRRFIEKPGSNMRVTGEFGFIDEARNYLNNLKYDVVVISSISSQEAALTSKIFRQFCSAPFITITNENYGTKYISNDSNTIEIDENRVKKELKQTILQLSKNESSQELKKRIGPRIMQVN